VVAFLVYNANLRLIDSEDSLPARYLPLAIWRTGTLYLDTFEWEMNTGRPKGYWTIRLRGHSISSYPIVTPVLVTPLYGPAAYYLARTEWDPRKSMFISAAMEKLCASLIAVASVVVMYLVLAGMVSARSALLLTTAYAFGTNTWVTSSQAMWQHGLSELLLAIVLYAAPRSEQRARWAAVAGICCALMAANRPADGLMALAVSAWFLRPATWRPFLTAAAPVAIATVAFNVGVYGKLSGGYGYLLSHAFPAQHATLEGMVGLLVSPAKGLMVFSPFFIILLAASPRRFRQGGQRRLAILLTLGVALELLLYGRSVWNSYSFGPRYLSGSLPAMIWLIAPVVDAMKRPLRLALIGTIAFAIGMQTVGAFYYPSSGTEILYRREPWTLWHPLFNTVIRDFQAGPIMPGVIGRRMGGERTSRPITSTTIRRDRALLESAQFAKSEDGQHVALGSQCRPKHTY